MDEFDRAVQVMYDSNTNDAMRREAEQRLNQIVGSQEGVRLVIAKVYDAAAPDPVKLISINYIQKIIDLIAAHEAGFSQAEVPRFIVELVPEIKTAIASWPVKFLATCNPSPCKQTTKATINININITIIFDFINFCSIF